MKITVTTRTRKEVGYNGLEKFLFIVTLSNGGGDAVARVNFEVMDGEITQDEKELFSEYECAQNDKVDTILLIVGMSKEEIMKSSYEMFKLHKDLSWIETTYSSDTLPIILGIKTNLQKGA